MNTTEPAQLEPKRKRGRPEGFVSYTARITGRSKASIKRDIRRGEMICNEALDLISKTKLDKGTYLDALVKMKLTAEGQVEQVRADLDDHRPANPKSQTIRRDDDVEAVVAKLRALYDDDMLDVIREVL